MCNSNVAKYDRATAATNDYFYSELTGNVLTCDNRPLQVSRAKKSFIKLHILSKTENPKVLKCDWKRFFLPMTLILLEQMLLFRCHLVTNHSARFLFVLDRAGLPAGCD